MFTPLEYRGGYMRHASPSSVDIVLCADQVIFAEALQYALACAGHNVTAVCSSAAELASAVRLARPRVCITDFQLSDGDVLAALREIRLNCPDCRVIIPV